jgi:hypothetical protein
MDGTLGSDYPQPLEPLLAVAIRESQDDVELFDAALAQDEIAQGQVLACR